MKLDVFQDGKDIMMMGLNEDNVPMGATLYHPNSKKRDENPEKSFQLKPGEA